MIFEQFYLGCLAHASYLIGSEGIAAVVDPQRDVDLYLDAARDHGLKIAHIIETHLHADFVSGHHELAERTGAAIYLGPGSGAIFPHTELHDGDRVAFGKVTLDVLHTPGHTTESICLVVNDSEAEVKPYAVLTGDTLFNGDVGRPDLSATHTPQELAGLLYYSLQKLLKLPDATLVYPAHGAGSMCGRNISADRSSTIGLQRQVNYALQPMTRESFVHLVTQDLPPRPEYFERDVELNRQGAPALGELPSVAAIEPREADRLARTGALILDCRPANQYCAGHPPRSLNIGLGGQFASWAGTLIGLDREIILITEDGQTATEARNRLARVGIERVHGYVAQGVTGWTRAGLPLAQTDQIAVHDLATLDEVSIVDVRRKPEWDAGHIPAASLHPLDRLSQSVASLDHDKTIAVHCKSGYRSAIACGVLEGAGFKHVANVLGGFDAWAAAALPVVQTTAA